jgi:hypothetical protein
MSPIQNPGYYYAYADSPNGTYLHADPRQAEEAQATYKASAENPNVHNEEKVC